MNTKLFLAACVSAAAAFFGGWLVFGTIFSDYYLSHTHVAARPLTKEEPVLWALGMANLGWAYLLSWILQRTKNIGLLKGFFTGLYVSFLIALTFDFSMYAFWDVYKLDFILVDIVITSLFWAVIGSISGIVLGWGRGPDEAAAV